jgi:hypothetical protein
MTLTGPLTVLMAFVTSAVLSRPKLPELEPDKLKALSADFERLRADRNRLLEANTLLRASFDAACIDRDRSNDQLRTLRSAHHGLLHMFAEEQRMRLQLERDMIEMDARRARDRIDSKRAQAPRHLPTPAAALNSVEAQRLGAEALEQLMQFHQPAPLTRDLHRNVQRAMQQMDAFICNCAPGRHELFNINKGDQIEGDDTL